MLAPHGGPSPFTGSAPGGQSRWSAGRSTEWTPLRPELVAEAPGPVHPGPTGPGAQPGSTRAGAGGDRVRLPLRGTGLP
jgi:hypothetical protein